MLRLANLPLVFGLLVWAPLVVAQSTLGELLDTGARKLSADEFKQELVQRVIVGPSPTGGTLEVIYGNGIVQGTGTVPSMTRHAALSSRAKIFQGEWTIDENGTDLYEHASVQLAVVGPGRRFFLLAASTGSNWATSISSPTPIRIAAPKYSVRR